MSYFQDDLFPDTKVTWEPALTGSDWFAGVDGTQRTISLKPADMQLCKYNYNQEMEKCNSFHEHSICNLNMLSFSTSRALS